MNKQNTSFKKRAGRDSLPLGRGGRRTVIPFGILGKSSSPAKAAQGERGRVHERDTGQELCTN